VTVVVPAPEEPEPPHAANPTQAATASSHHVEGGELNLSADDCLPSALQQIGAVPAPATA